MNRRVRLPLSQWERGIVTSPFLRDGRGGFLSQCFVRGGRASPPWGIAKHTRSEVER